MSVSRDGFLGGRLHLWQPTRGFRAGSDAVFLAAACPAQAGQSVLDLGCGVGAAMYCLAARVDGLHLTGVERDVDTAALARRNGAAEVVEADVLDLPPGLRRAFDHVICNPPYFRAGAGSAATDRGREAALREADADSLGKWVSVACRRVAPKGSVSFIARAERLADLLSGMRDLGALKILPLSAAPERQAGRVLVQGRKGARAELRLLPAFVTHRTSTSSGDNHSEAAQAILRDAGALRLS
ncbi:MAG: methyltransferase [Pseudomonadota bacterium]